MGDNRVQDALKAAGKVQAAVGDFTQRAYGETVDRARDAAATVSRSTQQQPLMALLLAGLVGYTLGWLAFRRGHAS